MEQVTAYKANDGKLFHTADDAQRHDNAQQAKEELSELMQGTDMVAYRQFDVDSFIESALNPHFGFRLFMILSLVHSK